MRAQIIPARSNHTRRNHRMRNFLDDVRVCLEVIRLKKGLNRDDVSRSCGRAVVPFEDPLTLVGRVGSMAEKGKDI